MPKRVNKRKKNDDETLEENVSETLTCVRQALQSQTEQHYINITANFIPQSQPYLRLKYMKKVTYAALEMMEEMEENRLLSE